MRPRIGCPIHEVSATTFSRLSDVDSHQGILAVSQMPWASADAFASFSSVVLLDGVQDPGNVGTIIRTAAWFGIDGVMTSLDSADPLQPKVVRASMGGVWDVALCRAHLVDTIPILRAAGFDLVGTTLDGTPIHAWAPSPKTALILGSEANGLSDGVRAATHRSVKIEGSADGATESLNVGIAAGILLHKWQAA